MSNDGLELMADLSHQQWSGWMEYLFSKCHKNIFGQTVIPQWAEERWRRQMSTPYSELSESDKDSDRVEAERVIRLFRGIMELNAPPNKGLEPTAPAVSTSMDAPTGEAH